MRIELICELCARPGKVIKQTGKRTINGYELKEKKVSHVCDCGGKIKPLHT